VKIEKVIRRVSADGTSVLNAAVAANIGEPGDSTAAVATTTQHAEVVQRSSTNPAHQRPSEKES